MCGITYIEKSSGTASNLEKEHIILKLKFMPYYLENHSMEDEIIIARGTASCIQFHDFSLALDY